MIQQIAELPVAEAFLATDAVLNILINVTQGMVVYPKVIRRHLMENLPFIATENILMEAVKRGGDRQELHEHIREHSMAAARVMKEEGGACDLLERIAADTAFGMTMDEMLAVLQPENYVGRAPQQVDEFLASEAARALQGYDGLLHSSELKV